MKNKKAISLIIAFLLVMTLFPPVSLAADATISADDNNYVLADHTHGSGDTITIAAGCRVTLVGSSGTTYTNFQIVCGAGVHLTLSNVNIDDSSNDNTCPLTFAGSGNTLTLASGTTNTLMGGAGMPAVLVQGATELTVGGSGILNANGGAASAGLGGDDGGTGCGAITITGGVINATGGNMGAGIGGGFYGDGGTVTVTGGTVTASGGLNGAGIGGGQDGDAGTVVITGGAVTADGYGGMDIGRGSGGGGLGTLRVDGGARLTLADSGTFAVTTLGDCYISNAYVGPVSGYYVNGVLFTGTVINVSTGSITGSGASYSSPMVTVTDASQDYLITGSTTSNRVVVPAGTASATDIILFGTNITPGSGCAFDITGSSVNLELAGSSTLQSSSSVCAGLQCPDGAAVTISSSPVLSDGSGSGAVGSLTAKGGYTGAGIGGGSGENGGAIRIEGGTVNALGNEAAAAIGGGNGGNGGHITISGGTVTASGSWRGAGIGGGHNGDGGQIAITGGSITARSEGPQNDSGGGAGIGGGQYGDGGEILISGGVVNAYGAVREYGCGIGGGMSGTGGTITISGGTVTAVGNKSNAGIGGSVGQSAGTIRITGGTVNATGGLWGAGIGGDGGTVAIEGGTVTAQSRWSGAGIGGNIENCVDSITISGGVVNATGGDISNVFGAGAGIGTGGGYTLRGQFDGGSIAISGGTVTATGGSDNSAGIGGGWKGGAGTIAVSGGTVYAAGNGGQDIGPGQDGAGGTLSISDTAAVFLGTDSCIAPATTTHTHQTFTEDTSSAYGLDIPSAWTPTFGAYLRLATLSFNANGGSGSAPGSVTQLYNTTANTANGSGLSRAYYTFDGWNTAANGSGTNYAAGSTFTFASNTTLYAKWAANTYTVAYNANGGSGTTASSSHTYNASKALTANGFTKTGCIFAGWATSAGGTVIYTDKQSVNNLTSTDGATVTLYAQWTKLTLSSSVSDGKIYTGGRIVLTPSVDGGEWDWDEDYFLATFNSPATFTALKAGTTTVSYSLDGVSVSYDVTIEKSELPSTGQDFTWVWALGAAAFIVLSGAGWVVLRRQKRSV